jgi:glycerol uptake facilitator-like aquaporin
VTVGRISSDTFAGIAPSSVPLYVGPQIIGAAIGVCLVVALFPVSNTHPDMAFAGHDSAGAAAEASSNREH